MQLDTFGGGPVRVYRAAIHFVPKNGAAPFTKYEGPFSEVAAKGRVSYWTGSSYHDRRLYSEVTGHIESADLVWMREAA
jgi:hypothetical protein